MHNKARRFKALLYMVYLGLATVLGAELTLRVFVSSDPAFYVAFSDPEPGSVVQYPYGEILYNTDGFADDEFEQTKTRPRVGYFGDSVCFGVGAGYGHRISEVMREHYPEYEHMNFTGGLGGGTLEVSEKAVRFGEEYELDAVVYLLNLNDILPEGRSGGLREIRQGGGVLQRLEWLRGRSYLYTYVRQILKKLRNPGGGATAYELYPETHAGIIEGTARRVASVKEELDPLGIRYVVLILPYEMQVSDEAARVYKEAGNEWEDAFISGLTQDLLIEQMSGLTVVDGLEAFLGPDRDASRRSEYSVGEAFVYNLGERHDWNHPNRLGHRLLGQLLADRRALDGLGRDEAGSE
jgi:hypothetical protein